MLKLTVFIKDTVINPNEPIEKQLIEILRNHQYQEIKISSKAV